MKKKKKVRKAYHHGDLRAELLDVAEELLIERGIERFTLRECARRAGVSHGAPAHHFGDAAGLLTELAATSFEALDDLMTSYRQRESSDAFDQFVATGLAYVDYALHHRARFQVMFRSDRLDFTNQRLGEAGGRTYRQLEETLAALPDTKALSLTERASTAWSIVHGFAMLALENEKFSQAQGNDVEQVVETMRRMLHAARPVFSG